MTTWVLMRGLTRETRHWGAFLDQLARALPGARIVALDLPGAGVRADERCPISVDAMMLACRGALRAQGTMPPYVLFGLSLGGMVAAAWTTAWPGEVAGCVLVNTSLRPYSGMLDRLQPCRLPTLLRLLVEPDPRHAEQAVLRLTSSSPREHAGVIDEWVAIRRSRPVSGANALRQLLAAALYRHHGPAPRLPVLVAHGAGDALVAPRCSVALATAWAAARVEHPHAGHDLPLDAGPWLAAEVAAWSKGALSADADEAGVSDAPDEREPRVRRSPG